MTEAMPAPTPVAAPRWRLFVTLALGVVIVDQLTKAWLTSRLAPGESMPILGDLLRLVHGQNNGALFGLFRDSAAGFALVSIIVIGAIVWYERRAGGSAYLSLTLGLLLGGAIGNLVDRLRLGYVVDFVDAGIGSLRFWTFNVADAAISCSILLLVATSLWPQLAGQQPVGSDA